MPRSSSGRIRRCSSVACSTLARRSASSAAARVHLSTPPAASRRETAATRWGQVSQNVVGNGSPASSTGACSVTAGRPNGQRTATRRKARGVRPSCCATTARSSTVPETSFELLPPRADALDDVEVLVRLHVAEASRFALERGETRRDVEALLERALLRLEGLHLGVPLAEGPIRVQVRVERAVVEKPDERERADSRPAEGDRQASGSALASHGEDFALPAAAPTERRRL